MTSSDESTGASHNVTKADVLDTALQLGKKWWENMKNPLFYSVSSTVLSFGYKQYILTAGVSKGVPTVLPEAT